MNVEDLVVMFFALGVPVMALAGAMVYRVSAEVLRQRAAALRFEEKLAAYRHAVEVASAAERS